jgi:branched-chain amino acid transport system permease protein
MRFCPSKQIPALAALLLLQSSPALAFDGTHAMAYGLQQLVNALTVASTYCLLAVAYALLHGITGRIVLSFGEVATFGAFAVVYATMLMIYENIAAPFAMSAAFAFGAFAAVGLGLVVQRQVFTPLIAAGQATMIASIGVAIVVQEVLRLQSGARDQWLPPLLTAEAFTIPFPTFEVTATPMQLVVILSATGLITALLAGMKLTRAGRLWRACAQNRQLTELCGVSVVAVLSASAAAAAFFAAASGWIVAVAYGGVSFHMGTMLGLKALFASIIGGFGTIGGAIVGGLVLASVETAWSAAFPLVYRDAVVFALIIAILVLKPEGLLGIPRRTDSEV